MTKFPARRSTPKERSAGQGAPSQIEFNSSNAKQGSRTTAGQQVHASLAEQYRQAAARNADAGRKLGGSQGFALISLAEHFARRASVHALAAGGAQ